MKLTSTLLTGGPGPTYSVQPSSSQVWFEAGVNRHPSAGDSLLGSPTPTLLVLTHFLLTKF
ncbi:hypothetical protein LFE01_12130 [Limosilactobacillus fermentum]|nr:hypothetical protein ikematsu_17470 [Limosilactobacillus fermentum]GEA96735.1 hypothetical protein LFE01_12130 [Limosilactobacillus fermentum]